jgi:sodium transport system permease protein
MSNEPQQDRNDPKHNALSPGHPVTLSPGHPVTLSSSLGLVWRLAGKELIEILRDRRTILTLVLMPLLLYPLLGVAFRAFLFSGLTPSAGMVYRVGALANAEGEAVKFYLEQGQLAIQKRQPPATNDQPAPHQRPAPELQILESDDLESDVLSGRVDVGIRIHGSDPFNPHRLDRELKVEWELLYREDSAFGAEAVRCLEEVCAAANARYLFVSLEARGIRQRETPVLLRPTVLRDPQARKATLLPVLVPLILILMTITGAVYPAIDVTAGERERGTLEILVAAPVPRLAVLFAKYVAVLFVAMLTAVVNLGSMTLTLYLGGIAGKLLGPNALSPLVLVQVLALLLLFAAFFSGVLLALTSFARSFKEAQSYLVPLMLLALMPGVLSLIPGLHLGGLLSVVPLLNVALLTRDLLEGNAHLFSALVVVGSTLVYAALALALAARIFGAEAVLYSQSGSWRDLWRRRR